MSVSQLAQTLQRTGQSHLLKFYDDLSSEHQKALLHDIQSTNLESLNEAFKKATATDLLAWEYQPPSIMAWDSPTTSRESNESTSPCLLTRAADVKSDILNAWRQRGLSMIAAGKVGCLVMAGGQGTRLGWDKPKGTYPIGAISGKSLFQLFAERIQTIGKLAQAATKSANAPKIPFYVMTADHNHNATVKFFKDRNYFGLREDDVKFFEQQTIPSLATDGKILLEEKHKLCRNPNGNGGLFGSMEHSGVLKDMEKRGLVGVHVFGVDNALLKVLDPLFIGYVDAVGADVGNKCILKTNPDEKVGMMCNRHPKDDPSKVDCCVVEYSELPQEMRQARLPSDGSLLFSAGNVCNHYFRVDFIRSLIEDHKIDRLHPHTAYKKIPHIDLETGSRIVPTKPNGIKIEYFIFDVFSFANKVAGLEVAREEDFSPVKNAEGEDSPATSREMMSALYKKWLRAAGTEICGEGLVEISPLVSYEGENLEEVKKCLLPFYLA